MTTRELKIMAVCWGLLMLALGLSGCAVTEQAKVRSNAKSVRDACMRDYPRYQHQICLDLAAEACGNQGRGCAEW